MTKRIYILFFVFCLSVKGFGQYNSSTQIWLEGALQAKFNDISVSLAEGLRTNDGSMAQSYTELAGQYKINKFIRIGLGYRYIQKPFLFRILEYDHRFSVDVAFSYKVDNFSFGFRPRYQHRVKGISGDDGSRSKTYNRNKLSVQYAINKDISLQLNYEFFLRLAADGSFIDQNRYGLELSYDINKKNSISGFYMLQQEIQVTWPLLTHVWGLEYSYSLKGKEKEKKPE
ncbi:MAG: DUF2490 domain-containing protein [Flavobacteriales bacterium]